MAAHPGTPCPAKWKAGSKTQTPSIKITDEVEAELK